MMTDHRQACASADERIGWALLHDAVAHPLMAASGYAGWALRFHDWTSARAWPRPAADEKRFVYYSPYWGRLEFVASGDQWEVKHPRADHVFRCRAENLDHAMLQTTHHFESLAAHIGGDFAATAPAVHDQRAMPRQADPLRDEVWSSIRSLRGHSAQRAAADSGPGKNRGMR